MACWSACHRGQQLVQRQVSEGTGGQAEADHRHILEGLAELVMYPRGQKIVAGRRARHAAHGQLPFRVPQRRQL